jgi:hypothetical protein
MEKILLVLLYLMFVLLITSIYTTNIYLLGVAEVLIIPIIILQYKLNKKWKKSY